MASRKDILSAVRQLRKDIMTGKPGLSVRDKLRHQCDRIEDLPMHGQGWSSWEMPDPLFPSERGHSVHVVKTRGNRGLVVSLTGKKIIGRISNMNNKQKTRLELESLTGAKRWKQKSK